MAGKFLRAVVAGALALTSSSAFALDTTSIQLKWVYQAQFAPDGNESGYCVGAMSATLGFKIRLERCGSPRSFWIPDLQSGIVVTKPGLKQRLQVHDYLVRLAPLSIPVDRRHYGIEHVLITKRLGQEIDRSSLHGPDGHRNVAMAGHEDNWNVNFRFG